jgi:hypothetical protein
MRTKVVFGKQTLVLNLVGVPSGPLGGLAQLVARMLSMHEVAGSIPAISTFAARYHFEHQFCPRRPHHQSFRKDCTTPLHAGLDVR